MLILYYSSRCTGLPSSAMSYSDVKEIFWVNINTGLCRCVFLRACNNCPELGMSHTDWVVPLCEQNDVKTIMAAQHINIISDSTRRNCFVESCRAMWTLIKLGWQHFHGHDQTFIEVNKLINSTILSASESVSQGRDRHCNHHPHSTLAVSWSLFTHPIQRCCVPLTSTIG